MFRALDSNGRTIWIADAHRDDGKRFIARADEVLSSFLLSLNDRRQPLRFVSKPFIVFRGGDALRLSLPSRSVFQQTPLWRHNGLDAV